MDPALGLVFGAEDPAVNKTAKVLPLKELTSYGHGQAINESTSETITVSRKSHTEK